MIIKDSAVQLTSKHTLIEQNTQNERLRLWRGPRPMDRSSVAGRDMNIDGRGENHAHDRVAISARAKAGAPTRVKAESVKEDERIDADLNIKILREMIQRLTGRIIEIRQFQEVLSSQVHEGITADTVTQDDSGSAGFGLEYDYYESHYEYEATSFAGQGIITTADGSQIDFTVELNMSREFLSEKGVSLRAGDALKDPLVINFAGSAVQLTQDRFSFDLDLDGRKDQISFVKPGSGFLALDKNNDGIINNGNELFGPQSGDGFHELAGYDQDGNGWIDEADDIYQGLRIWALDDNGEKRLFALGEAGVGAIYLPHVSTPFALKDVDNQLNGQVRDSGIFLREDGRVGTVQQIDLAV